jgi:hypothetical protein
MLGSCNVCSLRPSILWFQCKARSRHLLIFNWFQNLASDRGISCLVPTRNIYKKFLFLCEQWHFRVILALVLFPDVFQVKVVYLWEYNDLFEEGIVNFGSRDLLTWCFSEIFLTLKSFWNCHYIDPKLSLFSIPTMRSFQGCDL